MLTTMVERLRISGLRKNYGDIVALDGVELAVEAGEMVGFLGPNGAGKSTTMRSILGLVSTDAGTISWNGEPIGKDARRHIGYMPQERGLYLRMKVHEHIAYFGRLAGLDAGVASNRADEWIERVGLTDRRDSVIQELSVGNQQRVQLAVSLVHQPDLLVLDEPFAGLDPVAVATMSDVMAEQVDSGVSVVFSSHQLELVQDLTERVTIIAAGSTRATGRVADLRNSSPRRLLSVAWSGEPPDWQPSGATPIEAPAGSSAFHVSADTDSAALIAEAARHGSIASVTHEPPGLDEIFLELVDA